ncbi:GNAT family N-acetyltransferase [Nocardioides sp. LHG3406-4]|uniref:GNAT family N-acetyltransferase n=1 Tax=Nocardioides sp. LHG3406-4 TaxID=2804575 RepID=UPI003CF9961F
MTWLEDHWLDILGWGGSALLVYSLLQSRVLRFRVLNLAACVLLVVFNALVEVWPMVGMNAVLCAINVWFIVRLLRDRHDDAAFEVLQVRHDDEYLRHILRLHGPDILVFQPDFRWESHADNHAYLVQRGDETVGVVLLHADGDTAHVLLDYVTPRYRDFSPGEFVWRKSGLLTSLGLRRVVTPPRMVGAYYGRLGFRREGESFVLELPSAA